MFLIRGNAGFLSSTVVYKALGLSRVYASGAGGCEAGVRNHQPHFIGQSAGTFWLAVVRNCGYKTIDRRLSLHPEAQSSPAVP